MNGEKKEKGENRASDTMGMKHLVRFGLDEVKGSINVQLAEKTGVEMPICRCVYEILYRQRPVQEVARELMSRARKGEIEDGWRYPVG